VELWCSECGCVSEGDALGWRAYLGSETDDGPVEALPFCPDCAEREFEPPVRVDRADD
jgi:hypothetical protein